MMGFKVKTKKKSEIMIKKFKIFEHSTNIIRNL